MKNALFFAKGFLIFSCVAATMLYIKAFSKNKNNFLYGLTEKYARSEKLPSPKLVFIGGSGLVFGLDSKRIQDSLHIPVVNMGMHAGLGITFELAEAELVAKSGDKVVMSFEYNADDDITIHGYDYLKAVAVDALPDIFKCVPVFDKLNYVELKYFYFSNSGKVLSAVQNGQLPAPFPIRCISSLTLFLNETGDIDYTKDDDTTKFTYRKNVFNTYGDVATRFDFSYDSTMLKGKKAVEQGYIKEVSLINKYVERLKQKGVQVSYLLPVIAKSDYILNKRVIDNLDIAYGRELKIPVLNTLSSSIYPDGLFFDTVFHLNIKGREKHTSEIIALLKKAFSI